MVATPVHSVAPTPAVPLPRLNLRFRRLAESPSQAIFWHRHVLEQGIVLEHIALYTLLSRIFASEPDSAAIWHL